MKADLSSSVLRMLAAPTILALTLSSCKLVGPDHSVPSSETAASYKNGSNDFSKRLSTNWWKVFGDSKLNSLMGNLQSGNFDLRAAEARRNQAYAVLGVNRSELFPNISAQGSAQRSRSSENDRAGSFGGAQSYYNQYNIGASLGYEIDLWGRVRRLVESGQANAAAAEVSVDQVRLSLQAQLARNYFAMRFLDSEIEVLREALDTRNETLALATDRFKGGKTSELDVARAESELASTRAQLVSLEAPRASLENSIAILVGRNASNFSIAPSAIKGGAPRVPAGSPAQLLGRRPDVFVAERRLAASSAEIGVAQAEFFPKISLIGSGGVSSVNSSNFLNWSSSAFSVGPQVDLPVFQGFRRKANVELAVARHEEALAGYQQTVLTAFADVENALASRRGADKEISAQADSIKAARKSFDLSDARYKEGVSSYLDVVDSQRELLNARRTEVQARGRAFEATVQLIQALGGGFSR
ncbi:efflux transporter outer membrane subunit [Luteolibacter algae]|uniref:Efflux transporter outer membrane subunit n=1 Tax=Luteolibacter algae TaxID=454151 RepID=A0ABW5D7U2_9BACT